MPRLMHKVCGLQEGEERYGEWDWGLEWEWGWELGGSWDWELGGGKEGGEEEGKGGSANLLRQSAPLKCSAKQLNKGFGGGAPRPLGGAVLFRTCCVHGTWDSRHLDRRPP